MIHSLARAIAAAEWTMHRLRALMRRLTCRMMAKRWSAKKRSLAGTYATNLGLVALIPGATGDVMHTLTPDGRRGLTSISDAEYLIRVFGWRLVYKQPESPQ